MTPSLVAAAIVAVMASRTTKSDMRMTRPSGLFRRLYHFAGCRRSPMFHDFLFVFAHLPLQLVHHLIDSRQDVRIALAGDKIVLVLGRHEELDNLVLQIHDDLDHHQALEEMRQLHGLRANMLLRGFVQTAMTDGNLDVHEWSPSSGRTPACAGALEIGHCMAATVPAQGVPIEARNRLSRLCDFAGGVRKSTSNGCRGVLPATSSNRPSICSRYSWACQAVFGVNDHVCSFLPIAPTPSSRCPTASTTLKNRSSDL